MDLEIHEIKYINQKSNQTLLFLEPNIGVLRTVDGDIYFDHLCGISKEKLQEIINKEKQKGAKIIIPKTLLNEMIEHLPNEEDSIFLMYGTNGVVTVLDLDSLYQMSDIINEIIFFK